MNKLNKKSLVLIIIGLIVLAASQIASHYLEILDFIYGLMVGCSLGLMISGLLNINKKSKASN